MKTKKLVAAAAVAATLCVTIGGTLAWLTDTETVTNTLTVGDVEITLDEAKVDVNGQEITGEGRVQANTYKLFPGKEYDKDPTVTVAEGSEDCYVFVTVDNGLAEIEGDTTIEAQMTANGWVRVDTYEGLDVYAKAAAQSAGAELVVFEHFTVSGTVTGEALADYAEETIVVNAYAVQAEGFESAEAAWDASFGA